MASHKRSASTTTMSKMGGGSVTASTSSKAGALDPALHLPAYRKFVFPDYLTVFEVEPRFRVEEMIGEGAYGSIATACDLVDDNTPVAIKRINKVFQCRSMVKRTIRELKLLRWLSHENIIGLRRVMHPRQLRADSLYLVMEKMETDLTCVIRTNDDLTEAHHQFFAYQVVRALKYMHSANIVHRDLKPRNLLVNPNCDLKLCDFGLARVWDPRAQSLIPSPEAMRAFSKRFNDQVKERPPHLSDYVATRWYRAPEVILCPSEYGKPMDMWALGCILAELITRKPLFPGRDSMHQLALIVNAIGTPDADVFESAEAREIVASMPRKKAKPMSELVPGASPVACDLLEKLLVCNPSERLSAHEAIRHPYFQGLHWEADEPEFDGNYQELLADFAFERFSMCRADLGQILRDEILQNYAPPVAVDAPAPAVAASTENSPASEIDEAAEVEAAASGGPAAPASKPPPPASEAQEHAAAADAAPVSLAAPAQPSSQEPAPPSQPSQPLPDAAAAAAAPAPTPGRDAMPAAAAKAQSQPLPDAAPEPVPEAGGDDDNDVAINDVVGSNDTQILPAHSHRHTRTKSY